MAYVQKDGEGALFKNNDKTAETHAHAKGSITIDGKEYWLSAWTNTKDNGEKWQKLKATPKNANNTRAPVASKSAPADDFGDSEVPF
jgi:hypothetical protein